MQQNYCRTQYCSSMVLFGRCSSVLADTTPCHMQELLAFHHALAANSEPEQVCARKQSEHCAITVERFHT